MALKEEERRPLKGPQETTAANVTSTSTAAVDHNKDRRRSARTSSTSSERSVEKLSRIRNKTLKNNPHHHQRKDLRHLETQRRKRSSSGRKIDPEQLKAHLDTLHLAEEKGLLDSKKPKDQEDHEPSDFEACCGFDVAKFGNSVNRQCVREMAAKFSTRLKEWLLEVEMGFVWGLAGLSIVIFVFVAIWFIDPALLTLVLKFRPAECVTADSAFLVGISNCSWSSCRLGCTREIFKCWQIHVNFSFIEGTRPVSSHLLSFTSDRAAKNKDAEGNEISTATRLYPNVRGCGYPPELDCDEFFLKFGVVNGHPFPCWVSTVDESVAMTALDLEQTKSEVIYSLIPLFIFIVSVLYAFCRLGVFSVCKPGRICPALAKQNQTAAAGASSTDGQLRLPHMTPQKLLDYRQSLVASSAGMAGGIGVGRPLPLNQPPSIKESPASTPGPKAAEGVITEASIIAIPDTIEEVEPDVEEIESQNPKSAKVKKRNNGSAKSKKSSKSQSPRPVVDPKRPESSLKIQKLNTDEETSLMDFNADEIISYLSVSPKSRRKKVVKKESFATKAADVNEDDDVLIVNSKNVLKNQNVLHQQQIVDEKGSSSATKRVRSKDSSRRSSGARVEGPTPDVGGNADQDLEDWILEASGNNENHKKWL